MKTKPIIPILLLILSSCTEKKHGIELYEDKVKEIAIKNESPRIDQSVTFDRSYKLNTSVYYWGKSKSMPHGEWKERYKAYDTTIYGDFNFIKKNKITEYNKAVPILKHITDSLAGITKIQLVETAKAKKLQDSINFLNSIKP